MRANLYAPPRFRWNAAKVLAVVIGAAIWAFVICGAAGWL